MSLPTIHKAFNDTAMKFKFATNSNKEDSAIAVHRSCCTFRTLLGLCCKKYANRNETAIELKIKLNESTFTRKVEVKGLYGVMKFIT